MFCVICKIQQIMESSTVKRTQRNVLVSRMLTWWEMLTIENPLLDTCFTSAEVQSLGEARNKAVKLYVLLKLNYCSFKLCSRVSLAETSYLRIKKSSQETHYHLRRQSVCYCHIKHHFIWEQVACGKITLQYNCPTNEMTADITWTKGLSQV